MLASTLTALALTVVIDPGHGGSNTGAASRVVGAYEKQVTLGIARALKRRLEREGLRVVMTRERDTYLTLRDRVRLANAEKADLFISLHTNASPEHGRRGIETWVLDREAADVEARRAAGEAGDPVRGMLADLERLEARRQAIILARSVQKRLWAARGAPTKAGGAEGAVSGSRSGAPDRGVKQALYDVLAGVEAPAILVETGFIDHPIEGAELLHSSTQEDTAQAIADGVFDWIARSARVEGAKVGDPCAPTAVPPTSSAPSPSNPVGCATPKDPRSSRPATPG